MAEERLSNPGSGCAYIRWDRQRANVILKTNYASLKDIEGKQKTYNKSTSNQSSRK